MLSSSKWTLVDLLARNRTGFFILLMMGCKLLLGLHCLYGYTLNSYLLELSWLRIDVRSIVCIALASSRVIDRHLLVVPWLFKVILGLELGSLAKWVLLGLLLTLARHLARWRLLRTGLGI